MSDVKSRKGKEGDKQQKNNSKNSGWKMSPQWDPLEKWVVSSALLCFTGLW